MRLDNGQQLLIKAGALILLLWIFALTSPLAFPGKILSIISLVGAAFLIGNLQLTIREGTFHPSLWVWRKHLGWYILGTVLMSLFLSTFARHTSGLALIPVQIGQFVYVAVLIGIIEEIVFRGYVQGATAALNSKFAVTFAALGHSGYKAFLFVNQEQSIDISLTLLFGVTFAVGILLGLSRYLSGSLWPAVIAHAFFDFWLYGDLDIAPWWVW
ncbi:CPBP family intramembrane glutamic endopeptidase [Mariniradius sediminis]|uniref:CPBP family intramembrane metalloprotease n=1 Tax=Mariniradius sediminis TaxID=2909237 RepID=A0ABS9BTH3_9BACT|nr:CPBP family intramembrane glutamic endopeptidase [Mariniradius sediminis]MCF1751049.1 CPBP family intramembrane metalloprotease [Mariniradius sediminis]